MPDGVPGPHGLYKFTYAFHDYAVDPDEPVGDALISEFLGMVEDARDAMQSEADEFGVLHPYLDTSNVDTYIKSAWFLFTVEFTNERFDDGAPDWSAKRFSIIKDKFFKPSIEAMVESAESVLRKNGDYVDIEHLFQAGGVDSEMFFVKFLRCDLYFATLPFKDAQGRTMISSFGEQHFRRGTDTLRIQRLAEQARNLAERERIDREYQAKVESLMRQRADAFEKAQKADAFKRRMADAKAKKAAERAAESARIEAVYRMEQARRDATNAKRRAKRAEAKRMVDVKAAWSAIGKARQANKGKAVHSWITAAPVKAKPVRRPKAKPVRRPKAKAKVAPRPKAKPKPRKLPKVKVRPVKRR